VGKNTDLERPEISASDKKNISEFWKNTHTHTDIQKKRKLLFPGFRSHNIFLVDEFGQICF